MNGLCGFDSHTSLHYFLIKTRNMSFIFKLIHIVDGEVDAIAEKCKNERIKITRFNNEGKLLERDEHLRRVKRMLGQTKVLTEITEICRKYAEEIHKEDKKVDEYETRLNAHYRNK